MYPIPLYDILEILPIEEVSNEEDKFVFTGKGIESPLEKNLCWKAVQLLRKNYDFGQIYLHLHKQIPMGAGLGGGSADATYVLLGLNKLFNLNISNKKLEELASELGSDCAFFVESKPKIATNRGEVLEKIELDLSRYYMQLVFPEIHVSTAEAYSGVKPEINVNGLKTLILENIESWKKKISNDFELSIFKNHPVLHNIKEKLYANGAVYAAMSGSGSTIYGIYYEEPKKLEIENVEQVILRF